MSITFIWEEKFNVGDDAINKQHQYLFEIGNNIQQAKLHEAGKYVMKLFSYTKNHFKAEEAHMKSLGYPDLDKHREIHDNLITKLSEITADSISTEEEFSGFKSFVYEWLTRHILNEDMKYFEFEKSKN